MNQRHGEHATVSIEFGSLLPVTGSIFIIERAAVKVKHQKRTSQYKSPPLLQILAS